MDTPPQRWPAGQLKYPAVTSSRYNTTWLHQSARSCPVIFFFPPQAGPAAFCAEEPGRCVHHDLSSLRLDERLHSSRDRALGSPATNKKKLQNLSHPPNEYFKPKQNPTTLLPRHYKEQRQEQPRSVSTFKLTPQPLFTAVCPSE